MQTVSLKKGLDLKLKGELPDAAAAASRKIVPAEVAVVPDDFPGLTPRPAVKPGDAVAAGQPVITDKNYPEICLAAPVAGTVADVVRGERRKLLRVVIAPDANAPEAKAAAVDCSDAESLKKALMNSGLWALMRQRPYDIVPDPAAVPRDIFVTAFDSAPLAATLLASPADAKEALQKGIDALRLLTPGKVYVGIRPDSGFPELRGAVTVAFSGPHPAGNAGVQIAALAPVNKGETVWTLDAATLCRIGRFVATGKVDFTARVAITGSEVARPEIIDTVEGADIRSLLDGEIPAAPDHNLRIISGNVLTGTKVGRDGFLRFPYRQITVIPEGDDVDEFMGWASNSLDKMSESRSFLSYFLPGRRFAPDARIHGGRRAMIMSGLYDKVMPMDILPEFLIKAIIARDIDRMEALGIYEVAPEDFALAEYVDPSKLELQKTVREGLDFLHKELL